jgi:8-hydroxy-5-deazaflavin:NADPH oxidoreductase
LITAIIGVGNIGSPLARHLVDGYERVVLAAKDESRAQALAQQLGPLARAASVDDAIAGSDVVVFAVLFDTIKELIARHAHLLENKVVVDPSNPLRFDENGQMIRTLPSDQSAGSVIAALLPAGTHFVKAFGTLGADAFASAANRIPRRRRSCDHDRTADPHRGLHPTEGGRRCRRRADRDARRRPPPIRRLER